MSRPLTPMEREFLACVLQRRLPKTERLLRKLSDIRVVDEGLREDVFVKTLAREGEDSENERLPLRSLDLHGEYKDRDGHLVMMDIFVDTNGELREISLWKGAPTPIEDVDPNPSCIALQDE